MRYDIIADTHGHLSDALLEELKGADCIVHAGDFCSEEDYWTLANIAPIHACLGNNDWGMEYPKSVKRFIQFSSAGLNWEVCHYEERLDLKICDIAICGHSHRPFIERDKRTGTLVMNPGSPTFPRASGPSMGRIIAENGVVQSAEIIYLNRR